MTERQLHRTARYWQRQLRLHGWKITVEFAELDRMDDERNVGECLAQLCDKSAHILIMRNGHDDREIEHTIIHEHLHVLFVDLVPRDATKAKLFESAIDQTAQTLLELRRGR